MFQRIIMDIYTTGKQYAFGALIFSLGITLYYLAYLGFRMIYRIMTGRPVTDDGKKISRAIFACLRHAILIFGFSLYFFMVINLTLFSREAGSRGTMNLTLFSTISFSQPTIMAMVYENLVMLLPAGVLLPMIFPALRKWYCGLFFGFVFSLFIESIQLVTGCGYFEIDDILFNGIGAAVGYLIYRMAKFLMREDL